MNINNFDGSMTINDENITVILEEYQTKHFIVDQSTFMLLSAFLVKYLQISVTEKKNRVISMSLTEYMEMRGLKDRKEAKKRAQRDLQAIHRISFSRDEKRQHCSINLSQKTILGRDEIGILLSEPFGELLKESYVIPYPNQLWQLNPNNNPNSFYLLHFIAEHKNMNKRKTNADIIMVSTLLNQAKFIPTIEEVGTLNRNTNARIIKPFERDMNALDETLTWNYQDEDGNKVDTVKDYDEFIKLRVCINWRDYPTLGTSKKKK